MKKILILTAACFLASNAFAKITAIEQYNSDSLKNLQDTFRCEDISGFSSSPKPGHVCGTSVIRGKTCYSTSNCHLICNSTDYPFTKQACDGLNGQGGESCEYEGVTRYKTCSCSSSYFLCESPKVGQGNICKADAQYKYASCVCPSEYNQTCTAIDETGVGTPCNGLYKSCQSTCDSSYNLLCNGTGEVGMGSMCGGKYQGCTCNNSYHACGTGATGNGDPCTADGGNKYTSCSCNSNYHTCSGTGVVGVGTACTADGGEKYTSCACGSNYHTCSGTGVVGNGAACTADGGNKYTSCKCDNSYHTCAAGEAGVGAPCTADGGEKYTSCETVPECSPGDILADDLNCYSTLPAGRTAIGVMFTEDLAVDIAGVAINSSTNEFEFSTTNTYCSPYYDNELHPSTPCNFLQGYYLEVTNNYGSQSCYCYSTDPNQLESYKQNAVTTLSSPKGKTDTATFVGRLSSNFSYEITNTPLQICYNKTTQGLPEHSWFLPAVGDILILKNNLSVVNSGLTAAGGLTIQNGTASGCGVDAIQSSTPTFGYKASQVSGGYTKVGFARSGQITYGQGNTRCIISRALTANSGNQGNGNGYSNNIADGNITSGVNGVNSKPN